MEKKQEQTTPVAAAPPAVVSPTPAAAPTPAPAPVAVAKAAAAPAPAAPAGYLAPHLRFFSAGAAACIAETCSLPLDTAKVRLQLQANATQKKYTGMFNCLSTMIREEGVQAPFKGLTPGLLRQMVFATIRIGLYEPVRNFYHPEGGEIPLWKKIAAGLTTGTIGISIANPTDLVKIRLQAEGKLPPGVPRRYTGTFNAFSTIARDEGFFGLWKGIGPNIIRNSTISAAELATYDEVKTRILKSGLLPDNIVTHLVSGTTAGFVATVVGSPVDVTKTRIMNQKVNADGTREYRNAFHCVYQIAKNEGLGGFYKGFWPNFGRIGSWNIIMFLAFEQLKKSFTVPAKN